MLLGRMIDGMMMLVQTMMFHPEDTHFIFAATIMGLSPDNLGLYPDHKLLK